MLSNYTLNFVFMQIALVVLQWIKSYYILNCTFSLNDLCFYAKIYIFNINRFCIEMLWRFGLFFFLDFTSWITESLYIFIVIF